MNTRDHNVGQSDYSKYKIQPWDIWVEYNLNAFDADIVKRVLRTKESDGRRLDYEKIIHICQERIRQIDAKANDISAHDKYERLDHEWNLMDFGNGDGDWSRRKEQHTHERERYHREKEAREVFSKELKRMYHTSEAPNWSACEKIAELLDTKPILIVNALNSAMEDLE